MSAKELMSEKELLDIKEDIEKKKQKLARLQGKLEEVERRMSEDHGYKTPKHAKRDIAKQETTLQELRDEYDVLTTHIKTKYDTLGV